MEIRIANKKDKEAVFALRVEVFVKEQNVPEEIELDNEDEAAIHFVAEENGEAVGCARVILHDNDGHIGRLAVKKEYRNKGVGTKVCKYAVDYCIKNKSKRIWLNSQLHAKDFYEKLGFKPKGEVSMEAGIEHLQMEIILT